MSYFYYRPSSRISLVFSVLLVVFCNFQPVFSQGTEIFRSVGLDLNVDPKAISSDACGMVDVNNDGWIDLFPGENLLLNNGVVNSILQPFTSDTSSTLWAECRFADFDNDGFIDAYATVQTNAKDYLFRNIDGSVFVDATNSMGISYPTTKFTLACALADYNNDGWVDILVGSKILAGEGSGIWLWKNESGKRFVNVADQMQVNAASGWLGAVWADFDNDGDQDLFMAGHRSGDMLFRNDGNKFVDITGITKTSAVGIVGSSRSGSWGDYNNDGRLDLYNCDDEKMNRLYRNDGDAVVWPDVAKELHVNNLDATGWNLDKSASAAWGDYDNDGDLDLVVISMGGGYNQVSENRLYRNDGAAGFVEVGHGTELADQGQTHYAGAFGDVDNDGDLDLYISAGPTLIAPSLGGGMDLLFENLIGNKNNWLEFRLTGVQSNRSAIGARIRCVSGAHKLQIREVQGGNGYNSMSPLTQHFGFGKDTVVDSVIIRWPSGKVDRLLRVAVNQILDITEGSTTGIASKIVMPQTMSLQGNYPNPFNPQTTIHFSLPRLETVTLKVLDLLGREVRTLVENRLLSGHQQVRWDGRDNSRRAVATGVYLCQLSVDGTVITHQMTLLK
jgi:hypothetical protein